MNAIARTACLAALAVASGREVLLAQSTPAKPPVLSTEATPPAGQSSEPAQMSGYPLQVGDLPPGIVSIRVIRQSFQTNVPNQVVLLRVGDTNRVLSATTNAEGRVQFDGLTVGDQLRIRAVVGPEVLESQRFDVPAQGGVRMVLVAGVGAGLSSPPDRWPPPGATSTAVPAPPAPTSVTPPTAIAPPMPATSPSPAPARNSTTVERVGLVAAIGALCVVAGVLLSRRRARPMDHESRDRARTDPGMSTDPRTSTNPRTSIEASALERPVRSAAIDSKREAVFGELVRLERRYQRGGVSGSDYAIQRDALIEHIMRLDEDADAQAQAASEP